MKDLIKDQIEKARFTPSPIGHVSFPNGKVIAMNRRERRRRRLYGDRLKEE